MLPLWAALLAALLSGPVLDAAFPDKSIWPLVFPGVALVLVALIGRRNGSALLVGFVAGCSFYFTHIEWASLFLGLVPMAALSVLEALFFAVGGLAITLAYRWMPRAWPTVAGRVALLPVVVAGLWTAREAWASVWPYGGFSWGRVGMSQSDSPFSPLFAWLGISGVSFALVLVVAVSIEVARVGGIPKLARAIIPVALATTLLVIPAWPTATTGELRVAAVQGNGKAGYFDEREYGDLLQAQLQATAPLVGEVDDIDVVLWPEGSSDASPFTDNYTARAFDSVSERLDAPLVTWAVTEREGKTYNTSLLWNAGEGATDYYDKKHPVPFGEYIPDRAFWRPFAPDLIDLVQREYTIGTTDAVFDLGDVTVGVNICFDIVDDQLMAESVRDGAQVIFAQSNNADFGRTDESLQQLAIARIRAMELGRSVVNISTVGTSAIILPDGRTLTQLPWYTAASMVENVPTSSFTTPAVLLGRQIEWLVSFFALAVLLLAGLMGRRRA